MFWVLKRTVSLRHVEYPQHYMVWLRNKKIILTKVLTLKSNCSAKETIVLSKIDENQCKQTLASLP